MDLTTTIKKTMNHSSQRYDIITGRQYTAAKLDSTIPDFIPQLPRDQELSTQNILDKVQKSSAAEWCLNNLNTFTMEKSARSRLAHLKTQSQVHKNLEHVTKRKTTRSMRTTPTGLATVYAAKATTGRQTAL